MITTPFGSVSSLDCFRLLSLLDPIVPAPSSPQTTPYPTLLSLSRPRPPPLFRVRIFFRFLFLRHSFASHWHLEMLLKKEKKLLCYPSCVCTFTYLHSKGFVCSFSSYVFAVRFVMLLSLMLFKLSESVLLLYPTHVLDLLTSIAYTYIYV